MSQLHDKEPRGLALPRAGRSDDEGQEDETLPPCSASVTLSFVTDGPRVCFAAYNDESREIWIEECYANGYEVETIVERVVEILQPTLILVSSKIVAKENLLKVLTALSATQEDSHGNEQEQAGRQRSIPYQALRSSSFDVRACKALILQRLVVKSITRQQQQHQGPLQRDSRRSFPLQQQTSHAHPSFAVSRYHALASVLDLESTVQVQALGSLLSYLSKVVFATAEGGHVVVKDIIRGNLSLYMNISSATLSALHIFAVERHPLLAAKGTGNSKEGFSLFSMLDQTKSRIGRQRLREWMLKPLVDVESIRQRQNGIELFLLIEFGDCFGTLRKLLERVGAVDKILTRMQKCATQSSDFSVLVRSLSTALHICDEIRQTVLWNLQNIPSPTEPVFRYIQFVEGLLQNCSSQELQPLLERLTAAVDESSTNDWQTVVIRPGYNEQLDLLRERYDQLPDVLRDVGFRLSLQFPYLRGIMDVVFLPQLGFLLRLVNDDRWSDDGSLPEDVEFIYTEEGLTYFKNDAARDLDDAYGDVDSLIKDKEALLIAELEDDIVTYDLHLRDTFNAVADLDCILSLACVAGERGYVRPLVVPVEENCIFIQNGRHPLQEHLLGKDFVPNDTLIDSENRVNLISGPNFSGKSCYARQVGVLVYMAHLGSYLPCDAAEISAVREILVRFSAAETCAVPQSTFQLDLSQMGNILRLAGPGSLVLIDEFGKGTSPASGIALLAAAIRSLLQSKAKVVCTTHFVEVFSMDMLRDGESGLKALQMSVKIPKKSTDLAIPLFKLDEGVADSSAGLACAKMAGLKQGIIDRAGELIKATKDGEEIRPLEEILRNDLPFSELEIDVLRRLVDNDWSEATDLVIENFLEGIRQLRKAK